MIRSIARLARWFTKGTGYAFVVVLPLMAVLAAPVVGLVAQPPFGPAPA